MTGILNLSRNEGRSLIITKKTVIKKKKKQAKLEYSRNTPSKEWNRDQDCDTDFPAKFSAGRLIPDTPRADLYMCTS